MGDVKIDSSIFNKDRCAALDSLCMASISEKVHMVVGLQLIFYALIGIVRLKFWKTV
jgi:hypothetical protein